MPVTGKTTLELPRTLALWLVAKGFLPRDALTEESPDGGFVLSGSYERKFVVGIVFHLILNKFCVDILHRPDAVLDIENTCISDASLEWKRVYGRLNALMINIVKQGSHNSDNDNNDGSVAERTMERTTSVSQLKTHPTMITSMRVLIALCRRETLSCIIYAYELMMSYYTSKEEVLGLVDVEKKASSIDIQLKTKVEKDKEKEKQLKSHLKLNLDLGLKLKPL